MGTSVQEVFQPYTFANANLTAFSGPGACGGLFVSSASNTPLITLMDSANSNQSSNANAVLQQFVPVAATFYPCPAKVLNGLSINVSGNIAGTVFGNKG